MVRSYSASAEADALFQRLSALLRLDLDGYPRRNLELGVRVQHQSDPMQKVDELASVVMALNRLEALYPVAGKLAWDEIRHGCVRRDHLGNWWNRWHYKDGAGFADRLGLERSQSKRIQAAYREWLWCELESDGSPSSVVLDALTP